MKKTLIALMALAGMAGAATITVTDLTQTQTFEDVSVTYTAPADESTTGSFSGSGIWALGGGDRAHAALTFTLNLTELSKITASTALVTADTGDDVGIMWGQYNNTWGIVGSWQGNAWANSGGAFVSLTTLLKDAWAVADNESDRFITLTMTVANTSGSQGGLQLYSAASSDSYFTNSAGLGGSNNTSLDAISLDTSVIENAAVTSGWVNGTTAATLGTELMTTYANAHGGIIPEPATATLSLLALAGLAVRRRRK